MEHFALAPQYRNHGLGAKLLAALMATSSKPLCLEVEPPDTELARRRIGFYQRCGLHLNPFPYFQPALRSHTAPVPLLLMTSGGVLDELTFTKLRDILLRDIYRKEIAP